MERKGAEGSYSINAAVDMLCDEVMGTEERGAGTVPPLRRCSHRSITIGAVRSDGAWAREAWQGHIVHTHMVPVETSSIRATSEVDLLHAKGVGPFDKRAILNARTGRLRLLHSRVDRGAERRGSFVAC